MKNFIKDIAGNPILGFQDWEELDSSHEGIQVECFCEGNFVELPKDLKVAVD